jgi:hypothetical protein
MQRRSERIVLMLRDLKSGNDTYRFIRPNHRCVLLTPGNGHSIVSVAEF